MAFAGGLVGWIVWSVIDDPQRPRRWARVAQQRVTERWLAARRAIAGRWEKCDGTGPGRVAAFLGLTVEAVDKTVTAVDAPDVSTLRDGTTFVAALGALLYALARLASERFYGSVGASPDEVGVSTPSLLVSAGAAAIAMVLAAYVVVDIGRRLAVRPGPRIVVLGCAGGVVGLVLGDFGLDVVFGVVIGVLVARWMSTESRWTRWLDGWHLRGALVTLLALVALVSGIHWLGRSSIRELEAGRNVEPRIGPIQVAGLHAPTVNVWPIGDVVLPRGLESGACVNLLGHADGITLLAADGQVWRVPSESLATEGGDCD